MQGGGIPGLPFSVSPNQSHDHPLKVIQVLVDAFARVGSFEKDHHPRIIETHVTGIWGWSGGIRPNDHFICGLRGTVSASEFHKHTPARLGVVGSTVSVVEGHAKQGTDVSEVVFVLLSQPGPGDMQGIDLRHCLGPEETTPFKFKAQEGQVEGKVVGHNNGALQQTMDFFCEFGECRFSEKVSICDARHSGDLPRNGDTWVDQPIMGSHTRDPVFRVNVHLNRTKFDDPVSIKRIQARGLGIESDDSLVDPSHGSGLTEIPVVALAAKQDERSQE
jgi:hypothetical protein